MIIIAIGIGMTSSAAANGEISLLERLYTNTFIL
jgi:hypothetical protein